MEISRSPVASYPDLVAIYPKLRPGDAMHEIYRLVNQGSWAVSGQVVARLETEDDTQVCSHSITGRPNGYAGRAHGCTAFAMVMPRAWAGAGTASSSMR